jgi:hypothetical protein
MRERDKVNESAARADFTKQTWATYVTNKTRTTDFTKGFHGEGL